MKKVLAFVLVLGMASVANAALTLQVSQSGPDGPYDVPQPTEIKLMPTEVIWIGIHSDTSGTGGPGMYSAFVSIRDEYGYYDYYQALGNWTGGHVINIPPAIPTASVDFATYAAYNSVYVVNDSTDQYAYAGIGIGVALEFHCNGIGDVIVSVSGDDGSYDEILIHQIPEPMTMALLGLGGLGLLRRRR